MPGLDSTGPLGQGSQTGRKLGKCSGKTTSNDAVQGRGLRRGFHVRFNEEEERGFGSGMRGGRGHGRRKF